MKMKTAAALTVITVLILSTAMALKAQQKNVVGQVVPESRQVPMHQIDHAPWTALLQKYVNEDGQVNYADFKAHDRQTLGAYLNLLSTASTTARTTREGQLAFWINAYNAVTVEGILREYPTSSIRNHTAKLVGYNIWKDLLLQVGNSRISLNDIEHEVLRKMGEPRIHFAIVCASYSCPRLLNEAYTPDRLNEQLSENTRVFFRNQENFQFDPGRRQFQMSAILNWFGKDFGADQAAQLKAIAPYLPTSEAQNAALANSVRVSWLDYDWSLNEQKRVVQNQGQRSQPASSRR